MALGMDHIREAAGEVAVALVRAKGRRNAMRAIDAHAEVVAFKRARDVAEALRACPPGPWSPEAARMLADNPRLPVVATTKSEDILRSTFPIVLKAVRLAHALVNEEASGLGTGELRWMAAGLADTFLAGTAAAMLRARLDSGHPEPDATVPFSFAWRQVRPRSKVAQAIHLGQGVAMLRRIPDERAPVVARLSSPLGAPLELRHHEGMFFRPVLAPGRWEPVTPGEFAAAAAAGVAWVDSPFQEPVGDFDAVLGAADIAGPAPTRMDAADALVEATSMAVVRAESLAVIGGVVHRSTQPPVLYVDACDRWSVTEDGRNLGDDIELSLGWRFDDGLGMHVGQGTLARPDTTPRDYLQGIAHSISLPATLGDAVDRDLADLVANPPADQLGVRLHIPGNPVEVLDPGPFGEPWPDLDVTIASIRAEIEAEENPAPMQVLDKPGLLARLETLRERIPEPGDPDMERFAP